MTRRVVVHIDRLTLTGFAREDRQAIADGLQQELGRVLADPAAAAGLRAMGDVPRMRVSGVSMGQGAAPGRVGESVARGIGREVTR